MSNILITWTEDYSVGYPEIDNQHKKLVDLINTLYSSFLDGEAEEIIKNIIIELIKYTDYHFKTEEKYFEKYNYSDAAEHITQHMAFVTKVTNFFNEYMRGSNTLTYDVTKFLRDWLLNHIKGSDKKYAEEYRSMNLIKL